MLQSTQRGFLNDEQTRSFAENGFLHLKGVIDPREIARLDKETRRLIAIGRDGPPNDDYQYAMDPVTGQMVLRRINWLFSQG